MAILSRRHMLLAYIAGSYGFGYNSMVHFLLPLRAKELGAPLEVIGLIVGAGALVPALLSVPMGALADRVGPRKAFAIGTAGSTLTVLSFAATGNYWLLLLIQLFHGLARTTAWVASQTYITGVGTPAQRATITGRFGFSANAATLLGPLVASVAAELVGFQTGFLPVAVFGVAYTAIGLALPELERVPSHGRAKAGSQAGFGSALGLLRYRGIQVAVLLTFCRLWLAAGWPPFFQIFLADQGFRPVAIGSVMAAVSAGSVVATLAAGLLTRLASKEVVTGAVLAIGGLAMAILPQVPVVPLVYIPAFLIGTGTGLSLPLLIAIMGDHAPPSLRGVAMGMRTSANQIGSLTSPVTSGILVPALGIGLSFFASGIFLVGVVAVCVWLHVVDRKAPVMSYE